ncbi:DUF6191 domain-containing protein [Streptomyces sp. NPDC050535]|uniref:DUF6191 domain-containing protein n=1 Tax=Streptomyces sp. NPDC050535 TaxID=3365626 RepID=UPI0037B21B12
MFEELFAPGRKHTNDERKRLELSRVDLNDGDPGRGPIDLSSGKVVVRAPAPETATTQSPTADADAGEAAPKADESAGTPKADELAGDADGD